MDLRVVAYVLGRLAEACGAALLLPFTVALFYAETSRFAFALAIVLCTLTGLAMTAWGRLASENITVREGIAITGLGWIMVTFLGMVPYAAGHYLSVLDGVLETISGLSGTGATVVTDIEILPRSLLMWRALTHWFGGLGIIVIFIALLPQFGRGAVHMFNAESTGPTSDRVLPRIKEMAKALFSVYLVFTAVCTVVYMLCGMDFLVALDHSFSTIATGGFSTYNDSAAHFNDPVTEGWMIFFMVISSANFGMYVAAWRRGFRVILRDTEFRTYVLIVFGAAVLMAANLVYSMGWTPAMAFRHALFQSASLSSTTGFVSNDFDVWPSFSKFILLLLMFVGGCAGSTAGGLKVTRVMLLFKMVYSIVWQKLHPQMLAHVKSNGEEFTQDVLFGVARFFFVYVMLDVLWSLLMIFDGVPVLDAIGVSVSTMGSVGPGFGMAGATCTYADLPTLSKVVVCISMLMGRLESFTVLALLMPAFWRRRKGW